MNNILQGFPTPQKRQYKVYVRSITYNQAAYIEDCLNGVVMQETNFPFIHHIIDDCSTDGEQEVIKAWMEKNCDLDNAEYYDNDLCTITLVKAKSNPNYTLAAYFLKKNMYGNPKKRELFTPWREVCPYEALCEGDDWWISCDKLQRQCEYLETHQDVDMCACGTICYKEGIETRRMAPSPTTRVLTTEETIAGGGGFVATNSLMQRTGLFNDSFQFWKKYPYDYFIQIHGSLKGGIYYMSDYMSAYRVAAQGSWVVNMNKNKENYFRHKERVIESLNILNYETKYKYDKCIREYVLKLYYSMFELGLSSDMFDNVIRFYTLRQKLSLLRLLVAKMIKNR